MASRVSEHGGEQRTPLKGCVRVRSPNTAEQYSPMFAVRQKCSLNKQRKYVSVAGCGVETLRRALTRNDDVVTRGPLAAGLGLLDQQEAEAAE
jgi:hypothetical protein